jgi:hypothetical protein
MDIADLRRVLRYEPDTGKLWWISGQRKGIEAGCLRGDGYLVVRVFGDLLYCHRVALALHTGMDVAGLIDHVNGMRSDNRATNLREVTAEENNHNQTRRTGRGNASGFVGVQQNHGGWQAIITANKKRRCLGTFKTPEEARETYLKAKADLHSGYVANL